MRTRRFMACLAVVVLASTACSDSDNGSFTNPVGLGESTEQRQPLSVAKPKPFTVTERWWSYEDSYGSKNVHWAAVVANPNKRHYGEFASVRVTARNASGKVIGTEEGTLDFLPPHGSAAATSQFSVTEEPAAVDVKYMRSDWQSTTTPSKQFQAFRPTGMSVTKEEFSDNGYTVLGELQNPYPSDLDGLHAVALVRDGSGKLIGAGFTYVDGLPADGSAPFEISTTVTPNSDPVGADVVAAPSNLSKDSWNELARAKR